MASFSLCQFMQQFHSWYVFRLTSVNPTPCSGCAHPHAYPMPPCATHLLRRRPPPCKWLWTICQRPALVPPDTMLRMLSLRLGPAPVPEQAPPPLSLAPGEGPAPPCPPLSTAPLGVGRGASKTDKQEWTGKKDPREETRKRETEERRTHKRTGPESKSVVSEVKPVNCTFHEIQCGVNSHSKMNSLPILDPYALGQRSCLLLVRS